MMWAAEPAAQHELDDGVGVEAHRVMRDAVEMVAFGTEEIGDEIERHVGEGVVSAHGVPEYPERH